MSATCVGIIGAPPRAEGASGGEGRGEVRARRARPRESLRGE